MWHSWTLVKHLELAMLFLKCHVLQCASIIYRLIFVPLIVTASLSSLLITPFPSPGSSLTRSCASSYQRRWRRSQTTSLENGVFPRWWAGNYKPVCFLPCNSILLPDFATKHQCNAVVLYGALMPVKLKLALDSCFFLMFHHSVYHYEHNEMLPTKYRSIWKAVPEILTNSKPMAQRGVSWNITSCKLSIWF